MEHGGGEIRCSKMFLVGLMLCELFVLLESCTHVLCNGDNCPMGRRRICLGMNTGR